MRIAAGNHSFSYSVDAFPPVVYAYGTHSDFDFIVGYVVDEGGHVACVYTGESFEMTPERHAFLEALMDRTFPPPMFKGKPVRIFQSAYIREEERPLIMSIGQQVILRRPSLHSTTAPAAAIHRRAPF